MFKRLAMLLTCLSLLPFAVFILTGNLDTLGIASLSNTPLAIYWMNRRLQ